MISIDFTTEQIVILALCGIQLGILSLMLKELKKSHESEDELKHNKMSLYSLLTLVTVGFQVYPEKIVFVINSFSYHISSISNAFNSL